MKILMLGWELPPHNSGGLGTACYQLCEALAKKDADIEFILPYEADHGINFMKVTAASPQSFADVLWSGNSYDSSQYVQDTGSGERIDSYGQQRLFEKSAIDSVGDKQFDIVHAHDWLTFRAALRIKQLKNWPIILHVHSVESDRAGGKSGNQLVHEIEGLSLQMADRVIAVSEFTKRAIIRDYHIPADKIEVIHNSIEPAEMAQLDATNAYHYLTSMKAQGYRVVVNIGRLTIQKGLDQFLRAAQLVIQKAPKTIFMIVGSGELHHQLIALAADLGIGANVIFTDFQRGKRWRDAFAVADFFVLPSVSEPFGLTPLEAISYGTPSLVSRQSGVSEVLDNCLKVDFWDVNEMANKITAVVRHDALAGELRENAFREYQQMSWDKATSKLLDIYQQHIGEKIPA